MNKYSLYVFIGIIEYVCSIEFFLFESKNKYRGMNELLRCAVIKSNIFCKYHKNQNENSVLRQLNQTFLYKKIFMNYDYRGITDFGYTLPTAVASKI